MKTLLFCALFTTLTAVFPQATCADIHKCTDEYGNVAYLQIPCPAKKAEAIDVSNDPEVDVTEAEWHGDEPELLPAPQTPAPEIPTSRQPGEALDDCKKRYRDQIDEIDAAMRIDFSTESGEMYKEKLLALTQQLRACG